MSIHTQNRDKMQTWIDLLTVFALNPVDNDGLMTSMHFVCMSFTSLPSDKLQTLRSFLRDINSIDPDRWRSCRVCTKPFYAMRANQQGCDKRCIKALAQRKFRANHKRVAA